MKNPTIENIQNIKIMENNNKFKKFILKTFGVNDIIF
jgi:hypothetical protein